MINIFTTKFIGFFLLILSFGAVGQASATTYYVDAIRGNDRSDGSSPASAWRSLAKVKNFELRAGDQVLLTAGSIWTEPLTITRSGRAGAPISFGITGAGPRPRINAGGASEYGVGILNAEYVSVSGLEITNYGPTVDFH